MRLFFCLFCLLFVVVSGYAQKVTLSGYIKDAGSQELLVGASVFFPDSEQGVTTNNYGFYSITLNPGVYEVQIMSLGYQTQTRSINLYEDRVLNIDLEKESVQAQEFVVEAQRGKRNVTTTDIGTISLTMETIKKLPVVFGETDVLKAIQLLPGVQSAGEGGAGMYIRGGGPDQNLILLDNAVVYNPGHLFGFFSIFNADALKNVTLIKGGMPANYGGRLSSVLDVSMKEGNKKEFHAEGGIGLIASRLTVEGPIVKNKSSFMISGRRTYVDLLIQPFLKDKTKGSGYHFYDLNAKINYTLGKRDRLYLSGYFGKDAFSFKSRSGTFEAHIPWGNTTGTLRWNHQFGSRLFLNTTAVYNDYQFSFSARQNGFNLKFYSRIRDWNGKLDFDYYPAPRHHIRFGANYTYHTFIPNQVSGNSDDVAFQPDNSLIKYAHETAVYLLDEWNISDFLKINAGLRYSWFGQVGPYTRYETDDAGHKLDSTRYGAGALVKGYGGLEPRLNLRLMLDRHSSLKASVTRNYQYLHRVTNNGSTLPTDVWMPSTAIVRPQIGWQYAIGYFRNFLNNGLETSVELYYKDLQNQAEYRSGYTPTSFRDPELDLVFGKGKAYGAEFFIHKTSGRFTGWIGYTLSWSWRKFNELNNDQRFPAKYDRRHDLSVVASYELSPKWTISGVFVYGSGNAITMPTGYYFIDGSIIKDYSKINAYRIFPYHRLDLSAVYTPGAGKDKRWKSSWTFSIYNVYDRHNPYFLYVATEGNVNEGIDVKVKQVSIFPIIPSITYNFSF